MRGLLDSRLLVISGKGGVGKTTMAAALALIAAERGRRTMIVELGGQSRMATLFARRSQPPGEVTRLREGIHAITIDPDQALLEWLQALGGRVSGRLLASSGTFQYFAAAAPGAKELVSMVKVAELTRARKREPGNDLVILDAPATGHALGLLRSPQTFGAIARVGPIAKQTAQISELLADREHSAFVAVASGSEMAVTEAIEFDAGLRESVGRGLDCVLANGLLPRRFSAAELSQLDQLSGEPEPVAAAVRAAHAVHDRASGEHSQVARLRRHGFDVTTVPFQWVPRVDLAAVESIASHLESRLTAPR
jgi:hypothetical protein